MGAGKTTESKVLASNENAVLISEDEWLSTLYPDLINTFEGYLHYSSMLKPLAFGHVANILRTGSNVVMDFAANTAKQRKWFLEIADSADTKAHLIYLKASDEFCLSRIATRSIEQPERAAFDTESVFNEVNKFFQEPNESEGIDIQIRESDT
ncbi:MAG: AAA family ATPase [Pseudomonadales bacterium]|nr:AAA family ATPase [Pseudomonadales bacterium]